jgi:hypothetical protein
LSPNPDSFLLPLGIVLLTAAEAAALHIYHRRTGRGISLAALLPNVLAGDCLLVALAIGLARGAWIWISLALLASLFWHLADLFQRWK